MIEEKLQSLNDILSNKDNFFITHTSKSSEFQINFDVPIELNDNRNYNCALRWFSCYNTIFNITNKNNLFKYYNSKEWKILKLDSGSYEIDQINKEVMRLIKENNDIEVKDSKDYYPIEITADLITSKFVIIINHKDYKVSFNIPNTINNILGFDSKKDLLKGYNKAITIGNITDISTINIECDLITNSFMNGKKANILYSFPSNSVGVGYKILEIPNPLISLSINQSFKTY